MPLPIHHQVELLSFADKPKEKWQMSAPEKLAEAGIHKAKGTDAFKAGKFSAAMSSYRNAAGYVDTDADFDTDEQKAQASEPASPSVAHSPYHGA